MRITLPLPPNIANARMHWRTKNRKGKEYFESCDWLRITGEVPRLVGPLPRARIRATLYMWGVMETDNLMARLKFPVDWLVSRGYIVDDSPKRLEWEMPQQAIDRKNPRVEIELEAV